MKEVVATGLGFPEGPVVLSDGRIACCEEYGGRLRAFDGSTLIPVVTTGGAPNGAALASDGSLFIAQNGGVQSEWRAEVMLTPSIQRATPDGAVEEFAVEVDGVELLAPNDLCFGPDGRLYFTDPAHSYDAVKRGEGGRIFALGKATGELVLRLEPVYNNGIAFMPDDRLVWVESYNRTLMTLEDGRPKLICKLPEEHIPDGMAVADDGRVFIATVTSHGISVVGPDGSYQGFIELDDHAMPTNCAFQGSVLWVTDVGEEFNERLDGGRLWRVPTDATGLPLHSGSL